MTGRYAFNSYAAFLEFAVTRFSCLQLLCNSLPKLLEASEERERPGGGVVDDEARLNSAMTALTARRVGAIST